MSNYDKTIEEIDEEIKQAELDRPYFEQLEKSHLEKEKVDSLAFKQFVLGTKYNARIFNDKVAELMRDINEADVKIDSYYQRLERASMDMKTWWLWLIGRRIDDKLLDEKKLRKFQLYRDMCLGKVKDNKEPLNIERAKEIEIKEIMPSSPDSKSGGRRYYKCPLHPEDTASFVEYIDQHSYCCFGCNKAGDGIDLYMKLNNCDFVTAVKSLNKL